jgi:hypothetical protein
MAHACTAAQDDACERGLVDNLNLGRPSRTTRVAVISRREPIRSKTSAVPANDRFRPGNRSKDGGEPVIEPNKQKTIGIVEVRSIRCPPAKHIDLLP